jgi:transcriptional antiterminator NusG
MGARMSYRVMYVGENSALAVSERLEEVHAEPNVPTVNVVEVKRGRKVERTRPIIEGYVFARYAKRVRGVVNVLQVDGHDATVSDAEVDAIAAKPRAEPDKWRVHMRVRALAGPFAHFEGRIVELRKARAKVEMSVFGRPTPIWLGLEQLEAVT